MKLTVFHVFFLVLVMWAVPSHGRAYETESVIHNSTLQPYKDNLNLELLPYDFFYLVLHWSNSFCNPPLFQCSPQLLNRFLVHGLWPQQNNVARATCPKVYHSPLNLCPHGHLNDRLNYWWPNLRTGPNECFWKHEYNVHGSCFFGRPVWYFNSALQMLDRIPYLSMLVNEGGIRSGAALYFNVLQQKIKNLTGFRPKLHCYRNRYGVFLKEIYFCFLRDEQPYDCWNGESTENNIGCGYGIVKLS